MRRGPKDEQGRKQFSVGQASTVGNERKPRLGNEGVNEKVAKVQAPCEQQTLRMRQRIWGNSSGASCLLSPLKKNDLGVRASLSVSKHTWR